MNVTHGPETQRLLEEQMKRNPSSNPDDVLRVALMEQEGTGSGLAEGRIADAESVVSELEALA